MAVTPLLQPFVEVSHQFEKDRDFGRALVKAEDLLLHLFIIDIRLRQIAILQLRWNLRTALGEEIIEMINDGPLVQSPLQPVIAGKIGPNILER